MTYAAILATSLPIASVTAFVACRAGLLDHPDDRKLHNRAVPLVGGITIFLTMLTGFFLLGVPLISHEMLAIAGLLLVVGVFDDLRHVNPLARLLIQFGAGILMATWGGVAIHHVGNLLGMGDIPLLLLAVPLTALAVAGLCNAYNMIDGIDGLSGVTIAIPLLALYLLAWQAGHPLADNLLLMLMAVGVFLLFNLGPDTRLLPRIFLGDAGSVTMGFLVTASLVYSSQGQSALIHPVTALWLVAVPLMDLLATVLRRALQGQQLMRPDRSHIHHVLMDMGLDPRQALGVITAWALFCAVAGLSLESAPEYLSFACYVLVFACHCLFVLASNRVSRYLRPLLQ